MTQSNGLRLSTVVAACVLWCVACSPALPVLQVTATPPVDVLELAGSEVDPSQLVETRLDRKWTLSFGAMAVEIRNISPFRITIAVRRPSYLYAKMTPSSSWEPIEDRMIHGDGELPFQLAEAGKLFDFVTYSANVDIPEEYQQTATVRMVFVATVVGGDGSERRLVFFHDITASDFLPEPTPLPSGVVVFGPPAG